MANTKKYNKVKRMIKIEFWRFTQWRVFNQILVIILITSVFIIIQGYLGIQMFETMEKMVSNVFSQSTHGLQDVAAVKIQLEQIRNNYLAVLTKRSNLNLKGWTLLLEENKTKINYNKRYNDNSATAILNGLEKLTLLLKEPPNEAGFQRLTEILNSTIYNLNVLETSIRDSTSDIISRSNIYSITSQRNSVIILSLSIILSLALGFLLAASVSKPLNLMVKAAQSLAIGDLTHKSSGKGCREVKEAAASIDQAVNGLRQLIIEINEQAATLFNACQELKQSSAESGSSAQQVAHAMEQLSKAVQRLIDQMTSASKAVDDLSELIGMVSKDTENITIVSKKMTESARSGEEVARKISGKINDVFLVTKDVANVIAELSTASVKISDITSIIQNIAEQTTLLALNASIEAARAGIHGKGFSVVAKETGKLANQSKEATGMIEELINQMQTKTRYAVEAMEKEMLTVEEGKDLVQGAVVTFANISQTLDSNLEKMDLLAQTTQKMVNNNKVVIDMLANVAAFSNECMSSVEEVTATSIQQSASSQQVATLGEELSSIAAELKKSVAAFTLE